MEDLCSDRCSCGMLLKRSPTLALHVWSHFSHRYGRKSQQWAGRVDAMSDFKLAVDESNKATELPLLRVCGTVQQNPHMRAFWAATISFFLAFLGWFALAPLGLEVATSMGTCENQLYPPESSPTRVAYLKYKNISTTETYCQYGQVKAEDGTLTDCEEVPAGIASSPTATAEEKMKYRPQVLAKCVCTTGTECNGIIANAGVAAVASTIFVRIALGTLLERFGPVNVQSGLMTFGAIWVALASTIQAPWQYFVIRFFIGCAGQARENVKHIGVLSILEVSVCISSYV